MLDPRPVALGEQIRKAEQYRDDRLHSKQNVKDRYVGPFHMARAREGRLDPENVYFEYVSLMTPRIVYDNPRARVKSRRGGSATYVADGLRHTLNRQIRDQNLRGTLIPVCVDMQMHWGVTITAQEPVPGMLPQERWVAAPVTAKDIRWENLGSESFGTSRVPVLRAPTKRPGVVTPHGPRTYRLSPGRFYMDPMALGWREARFMGHRAIRDIQDAIAEAKADRRLPEERRQGWNLEMLEEIGNASVQETYGRERHEYYTERGQFVYHEMWVPEISQDSDKGPEQGYTGTIYTVAEDVTKHEDSDERFQYLRDPRPYYGPPEGPYDLFGMYPVPDEPFPMSALQASEAQIRELNKHALANSKSAATYKRVVLVDASDPQAQELIANAEHDTVIPVPGLAEIAQGQKVIPVELGGITEQMLGHFGLVKERVDRLLGLSDALKGNVTGTGSATENAIADASASVRLDFIKSQFAESTARVLRKWAWYDFHDDRVLVSLGPEAAEEMGIPPTAVMGPDGPVVVPPDPWFQGGTHGDPSTHSFNDLELEIEPYSMERTTEQTLMRNAALLDNTMQMIAKVGPMTASFIDWKGYLEDRGRMLNMPDLGRRINVEAMAQAVQAQPAPSTTESKPQPTSARDTLSNPQSPAPKPGGFQGQESGAQAGAMT